MDNHDAIERELLTAGFPPSYARDTAWYVTTFNSEAEARGYRLAHTDTFMDDLELSTATSYWSARAEGRPPPAFDALRVFALRLLGERSWGDGDDN